MSHLQKSPSGPRWWPRTCIKWSVGLWRPCPTRPNRRSVNSTYASQDLKPKRVRPKKSWCNDSTQNCYKARWSYMPRLSLPRDNDLCPSNKCTPWHGAAQVYNEQKSLGCTMRAQGHGEDSFGLGRGPHARVTSTQVRDVVIV